MPPKSLKSINLLEDGLSFTRGESKVESERLAIQAIIGNLINGDIVEYHMIANNNKLAKGKARIDRITCCSNRYHTYEVLVYAFALEPISKMS